ncbi:MAG: cytochrome C oxidase subunit IV family protein [Candidatus Omnitrophica bacterium]|nr:cytochrome C oxidase subunit IV family protein [Candidatus Omnitrophota bacterium]
MERIRHPTAGTYLGIYGWLIGLTLLEIGVVLAGWPRGAIVTILIAAALAKALLIALYFMHLKFDRRIVWLLSGIPVVIGIAFVLALFPDVVFHLVQRM